MYIFIILSDFLDINKEIYLGVSIGISILALVFIWMSYNKRLIFFKESIIITIIFISIAIPTIIDKYADNKDTDDQNKDDTVRSVAISFFLAIGLIIHLIISNIQSCGTGYDELLCRGIFILIIIFMNYSIYNGAKLLKKHKLAVYKDDREIYDNTNWSSMLMMGIWQIYIYMLVDGFKGSNWGSIDKRGGGDNTHEYFSYSSLFIISTIFVVNIIALEMVNNMCEEKSVYINEMKDIQYQLLVSTILTLVIVALRPSP
tara:strand:+ start:234 stop:1010 length:777 start_codon:yes stop_codon:yes gene_type:complete